MKSSYKTLIISATILVVLGLAAPFAYSQMVNCCHWEGEGSGCFETPYDTLCFFEVWHANTIWNLSSDTSRDTIIGCWYDDAGHGGEIHGYRDHATDSAFGIATADTTNDVYCSDYIESVPDTLYTLSWKAKWTGCCDVASPDVSGSWSLGGSSGTFWDTAYTCNGDRVPQCE